MKTIKRNSSVILLLSCFLLFDSLLGLNPSQAGTLKTAIDSKLNSYNEDSPFSDLQYIVTNALALKPPAANGYGKGWPKIQDSILKKVGVNLDAISETGASKTFLADLDTLNTLLEKAAHNRLLTADDVDKLDALVTEDFINFFNIEAARSIITDLGKNYHIIVPIVDKDALLKALAELNSFVATGNRYDPARAARDKTSALNFVEKYAAFLEAGGLSSIYPEASVAALKKLEEDTAGGDEGQNFVLQLNAIFDKFPQSVKDKYPKAGGTVKNKLETVLKEFTASLAQQDTLTKENDALKVENAALKVENGKIASLENDLGAWETKHKIAKEQEQNAQSEADRLQAEIEKLKAAFTELSDKNKALQAQLANKPRPEVDPSGGGKTSGKDETNLIQLLKNAPPFRTAVPRNLNDIALDEGSGLQDTFVKLVGSLGPLAQAVLNAPNGTAFPAVKINVTIDQLQALGQMLNNPQSNSVAPGTQRMLTSAAELDRVVVPAEAFGTQWHNTVKLLAELVKIQEALNQGQKLVIGQSGSDFVFQNPNVAGAAVARISKDLLTTMAQGNKRDLSLEDAVKEASGHLNSLAFYGTDQQEQGLDLSGTLQTKEMIKFLTTSIFFSQALAEAAKGPVTLNQATIDKLYQIAQNMKEEDIALLRRSLPSLIPALTSAKGQIDLENGVKAAGGQNENAALVLFSDTGASVANGIVISGEIMLDLLAGLLKLKTKPTQIQLRPGPSGTIGIYMTPPKTLGVFGGREEQIGTISGNDIAATEAARQKANQAIQKAGGVSLTSSLGTTLIKSMQDMATKVAVQATIEVFSHALGELVNAAASATTGN